MATDKNFVVKNGLNIGSTEVINSSGLVTSAALGGQTLSTSDSPTFTNTTLTGSLRGPATFTIDPAAVGDNTGTVVIAGNLQVDGTQTTINSTTMTVDDLNITLASGAADSAAANGAGITVDGASATLLYDSSGDKFVFNKGLDVTGAVTSTGLTVDTTTLVVDSTNDRVGIGTTSPTQQLDVAGTALVENAKLKAIAESNTDTAVDVFVYDTRKDSDGGAWRKRTQNTSWYNETLNTSTRGARKEFPCVAVIVAESNQVTIYDGDDPDMPMWMVFNGNQGIIYYTHAISSVSMLNGILAITRPISYGVGLTNFVSDSSQNIRNHFGIYTYNGSIVDRNSSSGQALDSANPLVNGDANDVAMTVLPNAPIDADTELPVPTIAVATQGGVSVIKDDGTVVDITSANGWMKSGYLTFDEDNHIISHVGNATGQGLLFRYPIPAADRTLSAGDDNMLGGGNIYNQSFPHFGSDLGGFSMITEDENGIATNAKNNSTNTLVKYWKNDTDYNRSAVAYINSDYNTGWMNGDIKLATLSDTDTTNATATNYVTNGDFTSNITGWSSAYNGVLSHSSGKLKVARGSTALYGALDQITGLTIGKRYLLFATVNTTCPSPSLRLQVSGVGLIDSTANCTTANTDVFLYQYFTATSTTHHLELLEYGSDSTSEFFTADNVGWIDLEEDRSVNNNGLQVFGTVTKTAVATGADLVAYSGFSTSNYLQQPYNSDLDFGTGDFCINLWFKTPDVTEFGVLLHRSATQDGDGNWSSSGKIIQIEFNTTNLRNGIYSNGFGNGANVDISNGTYSNNTWTMHTFLRKSGSTEVYKDGVLVGSLTSSDSAQDLTNTSASTRIGNRPNVGDRPFNGELSLYRIAATAPSPEQIKKIYEDEKVLFQENAKATLYGSSDSVTALAYDDDTELLHVGTSAGRSEFQGLRRINNTTDAVGTAISASNELVVED